MHLFSQIRILVKSLTILLISLIFIAIPAFAQTSNILDSNQATVINKIVEISKQLQSQAPKLRGQHPKGHGTVWAEFTVAPDLPENLRVGVFKESGKTYPAWIRFSNALVTDDTKPGLHGMAIKLMGVEGQKVLEGEENAQTQDFVMLDHPVFFARNASDFAEFFTALVTGKQAEFFAKHPQEFEITKAFQQKRMVNPLAAQYWSTTPYQFGETAIKFAAKPMSQIDAKVDSSQDYLRTVMTNTLAEQEAKFDFLIQLQTDAEKTPVEDPTIEWQEQDAPFQRVATIRIPRQVFDTPEQQQFGEALSFTPWHSLPEHQPLGSINRARKAIYQASSKFRHQEMDEPMQETTVASFRPQLLN